MLPICPAAENTVITFAYRMQSLNGKNRLTPMQINSFRTQYRMTCALRARMVIFAFLETQMSGMNAVNI